MSLVASAVPISGYAIAPSPVQQCLCNSVFAIAALCPSQTVSGNSAYYNLAYHNLACDNSACDNSACDNSACDNSACYNLGPVSVHSYGADVDEEAELFRPKLQQSRWPTKIDLLANHSTC
jgi:hypothetical protein